jgi:hypothetical protein
MEPPELSAAIVPPHPDELACERDEFRNYRILDRS